ncbi:MAG: hypothetical protein JSU72_15280, partial [Deltaproteobacteria bacterium]
GDWREACVHFRRCGWGSPWLPVAQLRGEQGGGAFPHNAAALEVTGPGASEPQKRLHDPYLI